VSAREFATLPGVSDVTVADGVLRCRLHGRADALIKVAGAHTSLNLLAEEPDLEELFLTYYHAPVQPPTSTSGAPHAG
jgi:ABC-2 type transport system ATP-binding protein